MNKRELIDWLEQEDVDDDGEVYLEILDHNGVRIVLRAIHVKPFRSANEIFIIGNSRYEEIQAFDS